MLRDMGYTAFFVNSKSLSNQVVIKRRFLSILSEFGRNGMVADVQTTTTSAIDRDEETLK